MAIAITTVSVAQTPIDSLYKRAQSNDKTACAELASRYRYGDGVEKSITTALNYYFKAGIKDDDIAESSNQNDELILLNVMMNKLSKGWSMQTEAVKELEAIDKPLPETLAFLKNILSQDREVLTTEWILSQMDEDSSADECMIAMSCALLLTDMKSIYELPRTDAYLSKLKMMAKKSPALNNALGKIYLKELSDNPGESICFTKAMECFYNADRFGLLDEGNAMTVVEYCKENNLNSIEPFSTSDIARLTNLYGDRLELPMLPHDEADENSVEFDEE